MYWGRFIFSGVIVDPLHFYFSVILFGAEHCPSQFIVQFTSFKIIFKNIFSFYLSLVFIGRRVFIQQFMAPFIVPLYWGRLIFSSVYVDPCLFYFSVILFGAEYCPSQFIVQFTPFKFISKNIFLFYFSLVFVWPGVF